MHYKINTEKFILFIGIISFLVSVIVFYPGWMSYDSLHQFQDASIDRYDDWHPVLMAWWWQKLNYIHPGPNLLLIQNLVLYWAGWILVGIAVKENLGRYSIAIPLVGFFPGIFIILGSIWKDVVFGCTMFFIWAILILANSKNIKLSWIIILFIIVMCTFAIGVKPNGITSVPFVIYWVLYRNLNLNVHKIAILLMSCMASLIIYILSNSIVPESKITRSYCFQYTQTYDLLGISVSRNENLLPEYIIKKGRDDMKNLVKLYSLDGNDNFFSNPVPNAMATRDKNELIQLKKLWYSSIIKYPNEYLIHRAKHFFCMLRIWKKQPGFIVNAGIDPNEYGFTYKENILSRTLINIKESAPFLFLPWIYIIAMILAAYFVCKSPSFKSIGLCLASSAICFIAPHFFILPSFDYRYLYYFYICTVLVIVLALAVSCNDVRKTNK